MSSTPGINPLTPDLEKIRHSDEVDDETTSGEEEEGLFDDPEADEDEEADDGDLRRLEEHGGVEPGP